MSQDFVPVAGITLIVRLSFDATYLYQYTFILLYNLLFTSLPVSTLGGESEVLLHYSSIIFTFTCSSKPSTKTLMPRQRWRFLSYISEEFRD